MNGGGVHKRAPSSLAGSKRHADESSLNDDQRFTKRFNLLRIGVSSEHDHNSHLYIPVAPTTNGFHHHRDEQPHYATAPPTSNHHAPADEFMQVDDTPDKIYIHDLDAELAETENNGSEDDRLIFLPDIEKRLSRLPQQVLNGQREENEHNELVLYSVPKSLTVDESQDSVRKAIIEARQRARERAVEEARQADMERKYGLSENGYLAAATETAHGYSAGYGAIAEEEADPDVMDIG